MHLLSLFSFSSWCHTLLRWNPSSRILIFYWDLLFPLFGLVDSATSLSDLADLSLKRKKWAWVLSSMDVKGVVIFHCFLLVRELIPDADLLKIYQVSCMSLSWVLCFSWISMSRLEVKIIIDPPVKITSQSKSEDRNKIKTQQNNYIP